MRMCIPSIILRQSSSTSVMTTPILLRMGSAWLLPVNWMYLWCKVITRAILRLSKKRYILWPSPPAPPPTLGPTNPLLEILAMGLWCYWLLLMVSSFNRQIQCCQIYFMVFSLFTKINACQIVTLYTLLPLVFHGDVIYTSVVDWMLNCALLLW